MVINQEWIDDDLGQRAGPGRGLHDRGGSGQSIGTRLSVAPPSTVTFARV